MTLKADKKSMRLGIFIFPVIFLSSISAWAQAALSEDAKLLKNMEACYDSLVSNRNGLEMGDKVSEFHDPAENVLVLPGVHNNQTGIFVLQYGSDAAAFQPIVPKPARLPNDPIEEFIYRIQVNNKTIDLRYEEHKDALPPHPRRSMTDPSVAGCDFKATPAAANAPVIHDFYPQASDLKQAFEEELIRRVRGGVEYLKFILPQPFFAPAKKQEENRLNGAAIESCKKVLKKADFPGLFSAFDDAEKYYGDVSRLPGGGSAPAADPAGNTTSGGV